MSEGGILHGTRRSWQRRWSCKQAQAVKAVVRTLFPGKSSLSWETLQKQLRPPSHRKADPKKSYYTLTTAAEITLKGGIARERVFQILIQAFLSPPYIYRAHNEEVVC